MGQCIFRRQHALPRRGSFCAPARPFPPHCIRNPFPITRWDPSSDAKRTPQSPAGTPMLLLHRETKPKTDQGGPGHRTPTGPTLGLPQAPLAVLPRSRRLGLCRHRRPSPRSPPRRRHFLKGPQPDSQEQEACRPLQCACARPEPPLGSQSPPPLPGDGSLRLGEAEALCDHASESGLTPVLARAFTGVCPEPGIRGGSSGR